jgi:hypothetical protein
MPACVIPFDPGTHVSIAPPNYDDFESHLVDPQKFAAALYSAQLQVRTQHQNQQLLTPPSSPKPVRRSSPFDQVPYELVDQIVGYIHADDSPGIYWILRALSAICLVSRQFNAVATNYLYRHVPISDPYVFTKVRSTTSTKFLSLVLRRDFPLSRKGPACKNIGF